MKQIWYEVISNKYPKFFNYKIRNQNNAQKVVFSKNLKETIEHADSYPKYEHIFMLNEERFSFFRSDIYKYFEENISITDLKKTIDFYSKTEEKKHGLTGEKMFYYIDTIYVNGEEKQFLLGEHGEIFFRLYMIYIDKKTINTFNSIYGDVIKNKKISIIPQSFNTLMFLKKTLNKDNFTIMYIMENGCKIIKEQDGFYKNIETINLGINSLKKMYIENDIISYRSKNYNEIESIELAKNLIIQTLDFYSKMLCKWMFDFNLIGSNIIIVSSIIKNSHFVERFNKEYLKYTNGYVVPFHYSKQLNTFNYNWEPEDMDALITMNQK